MTEHDRSDDAIRGVLPTAQRRSRQRASRRRTSSSPAATAARCRGSGSRSGEQRGATSSARTRRRARRSSTPTAPPSGRCSPRCTSRARSRCPRRCGSIPTGEELGSPGIVIEMVDGEALSAATRKLDPSEHAEFTPAARRGRRRARRLSRSTRPRPASNVPASWDDYIDARIQYWVDAEKRHVDRDPFMRLIASYLRSNRPPPVPLGLVHGDFQIANVLTGGDRTRRPRRLGADPHRRPTRGPRLVHDGQCHASPPTSSAPTRRRSTTATASSAG